MQASEPQADTNIFDLQLWKQFWNITKLYWFSEEKWKARGSLALFLGMLALFSSVNILFSYVGRDFDTSLARKNLPGFYHGLKLYFAVILFAAPVIAFFAYLQNRILIKWRLWLTNHFLGKYFQKRAYYHINSDPTIDNPDERIAMDIASFTQSNLVLITLLASAAFQLFSFAFILLSISLKLFLVIVAYAVFGTVVSMFLGKRLLGLNFQQIRLDADFRYGLVHIRNNAESIAFYRGEEREGNQIRDRLKRLIRNNLLLISWQRNLAFFTNVYNYFPMYVLPFVVLSPLYFDGRIELGTLTQAVGACGQVLAAMSVIATNYAGISSVAAIITRTETFAAALERHADGHEKAASPGIDSREDSRLALDHVTLLTQDSHKMLLRDAVVEVTPGKGMLIAGASGAGKSSLLRAIAGLWDRGEGHIYRPPLKEMLFLPQRPYMVMGSLRDQLLYPNLTAETSDEELRAVLNKVNLADLPDRFEGFHSVRNWGMLLSLGEQQRIAFARVLLSKPAYVVLDEATSALDVKNESMLYAYLQESGATYVSVGHRPSLLAYHDKVLELQGSGNWRFIPAAEFSIASSMP
jgi:putative ATP-binding cassette transporter